MKIFKSFLFVLAAGVLLAACSKHEGVSPKETEFNLTTTTGVQLAPSVAYIEENIAKEQAERLGYDIGITITDIEHLDMPEGLYLARVSYETSEGDKRSELWTNGRMNENGVLISPNIFKSRFEYVDNGSQKAICVAGTGCNGCPNPMESRNGNLVTVTCGACTGGMGPGICKPGARDI